MCSELQMSRLRFYCNLIRQSAPGMGNLSPCLSQSPLNAKLHEQNKIILRRPV